jgi:Protein of unknown function (DUF1573)
MKRIIITLASLIIASATVNAQTKAKVKKVKAAATKTATTVIAPAANMVPPPPSPMPPRDMQMPMNPGMPPSPGMPNGAPGMTPNPGAPGTAMQTPPAPPAEVYDFAKYAKVDKMEHNFGDIKQLPEGVTTTFTITNISKEPITIENVQASCGCTVPTWDKSPILPGKTGSFQAKYNSQGRPGPFTKSLTISTSRGKQAVTIKGNVEANPVVPTPPASTPVAVPVGH